MNGRGLVDVLVNGERVDFDELSLLEFTGVSVLYYINTTKYSVIFNSGISVTVEGQQELLGLVTLVPTVFKGKNQEKVEEFKLILIISLLFPTIRVHSLSVTFISLSKEEKYTWRVARLREGEVLSG